MTDHVLYANTLFIQAVLPLVKVVIEDTPSLKKSFGNVVGTCQVSAKESGGKRGIHFDFAKGDIKVVRGVISKPDVELEFSSPESLNNFFDGSSMKLPRIKGLKNITLLMKFLKALITMSTYLKATTVPKDGSKKHLLVKLCFYLLSAGISQLNKVGHPEVKQWAMISPDRVYAWSVEDEEELNAYVRVKAGKSKAVRGIYKRSKPFFTMKFRDMDSALGILLQIRDFMDATKEGELIMEGAPEYGALIGDFMMTIGEYAKGGKA